jgi:hypothetical protein
MIADTIANHLHAAARHLEAAANHDRVAKFWEEQGDDDRAELQRALADHERHGADLERRWAALIKRESSPAED